LILILNHLIICLVYEFSVELLWTNFLNLNPHYARLPIPTSFYFCDNEHDANECADLVVKGIKQATATSLWWYETHNELLPKIGDRYIVTEWAGNAKAVIETIKVESKPFNEVTAEFTEIEGEGDKSLAYLQKVYEAFYTREMAPYGGKFDEDRVIICEYFQIIHS
jgi:uncharacterized protein YhfF